MTAILASVDERTFSARAVGWINALLKERPDIPLRRAEVEEHIDKGRKRHDVTIYDRSDRVVVTGEIKMPDTAEGTTPYTHELVNDAHQKASHDGVNHFFTWNVNKLVVWKTFEPGTSLIDREIEQFDVTNITSSGEVEQEAIAEEIKAVIEEVVEFLGKLTTGAATIPLRPLDERFIRILEAGLQTIINQTASATYAKQRDDSIWRNELRDWMVSEQDWAVSDSEWPQLIERAARLSGYVLMMKLVFYEALRKKHPALAPLSVPAALTTGSEVDELFVGYFNAAMKVSNDYETLFSRDFGSALTALADGAVASWRDLVDQIETFDFTKLDYDILGRVFERLIDYRERSRYGQYYTMPDVVDLILSFAIRTAADTMMDPACGGGTFLVRAYARKKYLGMTDHEELISGIYGSDISQFAAHLSTVNLAVRSLIDAANYPRVVHKNFFDIFLGEPFTFIPTLGKPEKQEIDIAPLDAVVGNPPYTRQELLNKQMLETALVKSWAARVPDYSKRSDIHVYFWLHAATFLKPDGRLVLLTSSNWLDALYGFPLQKFMLENFRVIAVLESKVEPWFEEARVATAVTVLERESDPGKRAENHVRFVYFDKPLAHLLKHSEDEDARQESVEALRDKILATRASTTLDGMRIRAIRQDELYRLGLSRGGDELPEDEETDEDDDDDGNDDE